MSNLICCNFNYGLEFMNIRHTSKNEGRHPTSTELLSNQKMFNYFNILSIHVHKLLIDEVIYFTSICLNNLLYF